MRGDAAYDSDGLRRFLTERGTMPVIPTIPRASVAATTDPELAVEAVRGGAGQRPRLG